MLPFLRSLAEETARELWRVARKETTPSRLVLPTYRNGTRRVSEQEARSIAQRVVAASDRFFFSIETPTVGTHKFSGAPEGNPRSAQHDLSFYTSPDPQAVGSLVAHAEFKQGHRSGNDGVMVIARDLIKLIDSDRDSLWFHSFPKPTPNEFQKLHALFRLALLHAFEKRPPGHKARVILAFCAVVEPTAWIAGPLSWLETRDAIDTFPVSSATPHSAWCKIPLSAEVKRASAAEDLAFVDLKEPNEADNDAEQ